MLIIHRKAFRLDLSKILKCQLARQAKTGLAVSAQWKVTVKPAPVMLDTSYECHTRNLNAPKLGKQFNFGTHQTAGR